MEITNVRAHKIISDDFFFNFQIQKNNTNFVLIYNYEIQNLILFQF